MTDEQKLANRKHWDKMFVEQTLMCRNIFLHIDHFKIDIVDCHLDDLETLIMKAVMFYKEVKELPIIRTENFKNENT